MSEKSPDKNERKRRSGKRKIERPEGRDRSAATVSPKKKDWARGDWTCAKTIIS